MQCQRSLRAQDLLSQYMAEASIGLCAITEPVRILNDWFGSQNQFAVVCYSPTALASTCVAFKSGLNYVAIKCGDLIFASCYISPNADIDLFRVFLNELDDLMSEVCDGKLILCGDFYSHSVHWSCFATSKNPRDSLTELGSRL